MVITGSGGAIAAGSRHVADLGAWRLSREREYGWTVRAEPVGVDSLQWSFAREARVSLAFGERRWVWSVRALPPCGPQVEFEMDGPPETYP